ncbi:MAG: hypothetical protein J0M05_12915 [Candidatus Kapabacteria bacterium]|nr:hypothetical protein [Candidatus Kapabacteria bacterium]
MDNIEFVKNVLSSTLVVTFFSTILTLIFSIVLKKFEYKNEYYKKILDKRLEAYKFLEIQIAVLKNTVVDTDKQPYHMMFSYGEDEFYEFQRNLNSAFAYSIWIHQDTVSEMENLNQIFFKISQRITEGKDEQLVELGKEYYKDVASSRIKMEDLVRRDLLNLHDLTKFMKGQKRRGMRVFYIDK